MTKLIYKPNPQITRIIEDESLVSLYLGTNEWEIEKATVEKEVVAEPIVEHKEEPNINPNKKK